MVKAKKPNFCVEDLAKKLADYEASRVGKMKGKKISIKELCQVWGMAKNSTTKWRKLVRGKYFLPGIFR